MLRWSMVFFIIAVIAAVLGFSTLASSVAGLAKVFFFVFLVLAIFSLARTRRTT